MSKAKTQQRKVFSNKALPTDIDDLTAVRDVLEGADLASAEYDPLKDPFFEAGHGGRMRTYAGSDLRPQVVQEYAHLVYLSLTANAQRESTRKVTTDGSRVKRYEHPSDAELRRRAKEIVASHTLTTMDFAYMDRYKPQSVWADEMDGIPHELRIGALLLEPQLAWLYRYLMRKTGQRGPAPAKMKAAAVLLLQAWSTEPKSIDTVRLAHWEANAQRAHVFSYPKDDPSGAAPMSKSGFWESFVNLVDDVDVRVLQHVMVGTYFATRDALGVDEADDDVLVADGSFTEASMRQGAPRDEEHRRIRQRSRARLTSSYRAYGSDGVFRKSVMGYRLVVLVSMKTGRPVISCVVGSDEEERDAVLYLVRRLREIRPDHRFQYLAGDGIYGWGTDWLRTMMFAEALIPVAPWRRNYNSMLDGKANDGKHYNHGVPVCGCGPMRRVGWQETWWGPDKRLSAVDADGAPLYPRGKRAPNHKRLKQRFECVTKTHPNKVTFPWHDPAILSPLPHARPAMGADSKWCSMRVSMLLYRNVVESVYAAIQRLGLQGHGGQRPEWATDHGAHVLLLLGLTFISGRRLINAPSVPGNADSSSLARYLAELERLGLRDDVGAGERAGPDPAELIAALDARSEWVDPPMPPASLIREMPALADDLTGSARFNVRAAAARRLRPSIN